MAKTTLTALLRKYDNLSDSISGVQGCPSWEVNGQVAHLENVSEYAMELARMIANGVRKSASTEDSILMAERLIDKSTRLVESYRCTTDSPVWDYV